MTTNTKRLTKIQALLAKAEHGATPEEAKSLVAKAQELMVKWGIEEAQLRAAGREAQIADIGVTQMWVEYSPYQTPKIGLLVTVARSQDCQIVKSSGCYDATGARGSWVQVIGTSRKREFVGMLYTSLLVQAATEFQSPKVQTRLFTETSHPGHRIKWRNGFMNGYAIAIGKRLRDMKKATEDQAESDQPGTSVVLANEADMVKSYVRDKYPRLRTDQARAGGTAGRSSGHEAAQRADLGSPRFAQRRELQ